MLSNIKFVAKIGIAKIHLTLDSCSRRVEASRLAVFAVFLERGHKDSEIFRTKEVHSPDYALGRKSWSWVKIM